MDSFAEIKSIDEIVLFDGVCNFCNASVNFVIKTEKNNNLRFTPLQSSLSKKLSETYDFDVDQLNTIVFIKGRHAYFKSQAIFEISSYLKFPWNMLIILKLLPRALTDFFYNFISKGRYSFFGKRNNCMIPSFELKNRFLDSI